MPQPTPEQWWDALDDADRKAFEDAAQRPYPLARELADKLSAAGVTVMEAHFPESGDPMEPIFPRQYVEYAREQARLRAANPEWRDHG
jgi:TRAP-type C4-dicarboxylate transport system substrate-binding protein